MSQESLRARPRLLVLASTYPRWTGDHEPGFVHELSKRLARSFQVIVLCPHAPGAKRHEVMDDVHVIRYRYAPERLETLVNDGGIVTNLKRSRWKYLLLPTLVLAQAWCAWRILRRERIDVVHAHWLIPQGLIAALLQWLPGRSVPYLVTSHGADLYALRGSLMDAMKRFVASRAGRITVVSSAMRGELERLGIPRERVSVEPMGVDLAKRFTPDHAVQRSTTELLFVGRMVEKKGLRHLLDAMPLILAKVPDAQLTVAGFGPELEARKAQAHALGIEGNVSFIGAVPQAGLPALYRRAAVFVAPFVEASGGDQEGLGLVSVEAIGCGCPVVVSDLPAVRQVFPEGEGASLVPPGDSSALAVAVVSRLMRRDEAASVAARMRAKDAFDWECRAGAYASHLLSAVKCRVDKMQQ